MTKKTKASQSEKSFSLSLVRPGEDRAPGKVPDDLRWALEGKAENATVHDNLKTLLVELKAQGVGFVGMNFTGKVTHECLSNFIFYKRADSNPMTKTAETIYPNRAGKGVWVKPMRIRNCPMSWINHEFDHDKESIVRTRRSLPLREAVSRLSDMVLALFFGSFWRLGDATKLIETDGALLLDVEKGLFSCDFDRKTRQTGFRALTVGDDNIVAHDRERPPIS